MLTFRQNQRIQRGIEVVSVAEHRFCDSELCGVVLVNSHSHLNDIGRRVLGGIVAVFGHQIVVVADVVALVLALAFSDIGDTSMALNAILTKSLTLSVRLVASTNVSGLST